MTGAFHSTTTLREIRAAGPCGIRKADNCGWGRLLAGLGEPHSKPNLDREVTVLEVLTINGLDDAIWVLRCPSLDRLSRHFRAWCAEQVLHNFEADRPDDPRVRNQISMLRNDDASAAASAAARAAARAAADAAWAAASAAASAAESAAARAAQERQLRLMIGGAA